MTKTMQQLADDALSVQDACNPPGTARGVTMTKRTNKSYRKEMAKLKWDKRKRKNEALVKTVNARSVMLENKSGMKLAIHPATRPDRESDWQLTTFGADGMPFGHTNPPSFTEAVLRAVGASEHCYWNKHGYSITEVIR